MKIREADVQKAIRDLFAAEGIPCFRMQTGVTRATYKGKDRFIRYGEKGMADLLAVVPVCYTRICCTTHDYFHRHALWIEVKAPGGKQSAEQESFQEYVATKGMTYLLADSVDTVRDWLKCQGCIR